MNFCGPLCRKDTEFRVTGDDHLTGVYFDGVPQIPPQDPDNWRIVKKFTLPGTVSVIAISANNTDRAGGILCSDTKGTIISDRTWKCTDSVPSGHKWTEPDYDDSFWESPCISDRNMAGGPRNQSMSDFSSKAFWIWSGCGQTESPFDNWDKYCYCRLTLPSY